MRTRTVRKVSTTTASHSELDMARRRLRELYRRSSIPTDGTGSVQPMTRETMAQIDAVARQIARLQEAE